MLANMKLLPAFFYKNYLNRESYMPYENIFYDESNNIERVLSIYVAFYKLMVQIIGKVYLTRILKAIYI
jgi:hypothetical protein